MINYAHRGASEYAPENTMSAFYLGLIYGADGIETDVQRTKDGELVLFHDDTLDRVTDGSGTVRDYTLSELKSLKVYGGCTTGFYDKIVTLREFLEVFSKYNIHFAIELKHEGLESEVLKLAEEFGIYGKMTVTSFNFDYLREIKRINPRARIGWLVCGSGEEQIEQLAGINGEEMAPEAGKLTEEAVRRLRAAGLGMRAWGVTDTALMKKMCRLGADGMTVNFPDRLFEYINAVKI